MRPELLLANAAAATEDGSVLILEAMMGLFDGAADGTGAPADLAQHSGLAVILVVDCAAPLPFPWPPWLAAMPVTDDDVRVAGVILKQGRQRPA